MKRGCLLAAGLGILLAIPLVIFVALRWSDIPPVDDSDLVLPSRNIDPIQNPFPEIRSFELSADAQASADRAWSMIRGEEEMDEAFIENLLSIEAETLERFKTFSRMTDWKIDHELAIDSDMPYLSSWLAIARLKAAETGHAIRAGHPDEAIESGLSILRFAEGIHRAEGGFIHQMFSSAIANIGIVEILKIVETGQLSPDQLARLAEALSSISFSSEVFAQAYVVEYRTYVDVIDDLAAGRVDIGQLQASEKNQGEPGLPPAPFFFKRNKTTKLLADAYRQFIAEAQMVRSEAPATPLADAKAIRENTGALYFSGNLVGRILFSIIVPAGQQLNDTQAVMRVSLSLLQSRVAIEQYRIETGDWPASLGDLVPKFIEAIPIDPMDGQPLRYLSGEKVLYSVGVDFKDDGGVTPKDEGSLKSRDEIVIEIRSDSDDAK